MGDSRYPFATSGLGSSFPTFVSAAFYASPVPTWRLTFTVPITGTDGPIDLDKWGVLQGITTIVPSTVHVADGTIRLIHPSFTAFDDQVVYAGPPPKFLHANPGWVLPFVGDLYKP